MSLVTRPEPTTPAEELALKPFEYQQKVEACKALYFAYQGRHHEMIQQEMRELGHATWNRRALYGSTKNGKFTPGWPKRYEWVKGAMAARAEPPASAGGVDPEQGRLTDPSRSAGTGVCRTNEASSTVSMPPADAGGSAFCAWLKRVASHYTFDKPFQKHIIDVLERVTNGTCKRLMIFMPPRHGKSELVTQLYSAWRLKKDPKLRIAIASYGQKLADRFSRGIKRALARDAEISATENTEAVEDELPHDQDTCKGCKSGGKPAFHTCHCNDVDHPHNAVDGCRKCNSSTQQQTVRKAGLPPPDAATYTTRRKNSDSEWETPEGGGVYAVGVGGGITGRGAHLVIVDDPVKGHAQAESEGQRDSLMEWFNRDIYTRLEPDGAIILIQTRWHSDDLAGRLLKEMEDEDGEKWEVISFPAIAEEVTEDKEDLTTEAQRRGEEMEGGSVEANDESGTHAENHLSPTGTNNKAQGKAEVRGRHPGFDHNDHSDPEGVEYADVNIAPPQGAHAGYHRFPGVPPKRLHPRLYYPSPLGTKHSPFSTFHSPFAWAPGEALWPERYPIERLLRTKKRLGTYAFSALYQQRPTPVDGEIFKRHWFRITDFPPHGIKWKRGWDLGSSAKPNSDYTASARVGYDDDGNIYIDKVIRRQMTYPQQKRLVTDMIKNEPDTQHIIEDSSNGTALIQDLRADPTLRGKKFLGLKVTEPKTARALRWNALAEEGRLFLVRAPWNSDFIQEACSFPLGQHDDQIDAVSIAVHQHAKHGEKRLYRF